MIGRLGKVLFSTSSQPEIGKSKGFFGEPLARDHPTWQILEAELAMTPCSSMCTYKTPSVCRFKTFPCVPGSKRAASNYRRYSLIINRKQFLTAKNYRHYRRYRRYSFKSKMGIGKIMVGRWVRTCPSIYLFRLKIAVGCLTSTYPSIHFFLCAETLKITVGCPLCTYPSIHVETLKITVGCLVCGVVCVVWCAGVLWWCVVKLGTLSLSLFPFLSLSYLSFSLFFFFFFYSCSFLLLLLLSATTAATSSSAIVGKCEQGGKQSINQKCF